MPPMSKASPSSPLSQRSIPPNTRATSRLERRLVASPGPYPVDAKAFVEHRADRRERRERAQADEESRQGDDE